MSHWFYLGLAIVFEVIATTALKATTGFSPMAFAAGRHRLCRSILFSLPESAQRADRCCLCRLVRRWCCPDRPPGLAGPWPALNLAACAGIALIVAGVIAQRLWPERAQPPLSGHGQFHQFALQGKPDRQTNRAGVARKQRRIAFELRPVIFRFRRQLSRCQAARSCNR